MYELNLPELDMSLFGKLKDAVVGGVKGLVTGGPIGGVLGALGGLSGTSANAVLRPQVINPTGTMYAGIGNVLPALPGVGAMGRAALPALRTAGRAIATRAGPIGAAVSVGLAAKEVYDAYGNRVRRRRRMNPMNARAARRAIRRIKAVRKIVRQIESSLPKQRTTGRARAHAPGCGCPVCK